MAYEQGMYRVLARYYDYIYRFYEESFVPKMVDFVEKILHSIDAKSVLDLGCGTGYPTSLLAGRGFEVTCLDVNRPVLEVARGRLGLGNVPSLVEGDAAALPLRDRCFDAVTMFFSSIQYIGPFERLAEMLRGVKRVLREGGVFIFDAHNPLHPRRGGDVTVWDTEGPDNEHLVMIDYREVESLEGVLTLKRLIHILRPDGNVKTFLIIDRLYLYTANEYRMALRSAGFSKVEVYGGYDEKLKGVKSSGRIVIVAYA